MDLYKLPNILIIQLKRFSKDGDSMRSGFGMGMRSMISSSKNSDLVSFPVSNLDMKKYVLDPNEYENYSYDLFAISNHMGSLYGGHYTAHCKNSLDGKWYEFNDSSVSSAREEGLVCSSAYVLFYRRRDLTSEQFTDQGVDVEMLD